MHFLIICSQTILEHYSHKWSRKHLQMNEKKLPTNSFTFKMLLFSRMKGLAPGSEPVRPALRIFPTF